MARQAWNANKKTENHRHSLSYYPLVELVVHVIPGRAW